MTEAIFGAERFDRGPTGRAQHQSPMEGAMLRKSELRLRGAKPRMNSATEEPHCTRRNRKDGTGEV